MGEFEFSERASRVKKEGSVGHPCENCPEHPHILDDISDLKDSMKGICSLTKAAVPKQWFLWIVGGLTIAFFSLSIGLFHGQQALGKDIAKLTTQVGIIGERVDIYVKTDRVRLYKLENRLDHIFDEDNNDG